MNDLLTSFPIVILTGAGASKSLGKATTYDIYDSPEFEERCRVSPFNVLGELRAFLRQDDAEDPVDLEFLLDYVLDLNVKFDHLHRVPHYHGYLENMVPTRRNFDEAYQQALDFMVEYYGNVDRDMAAALYEPFFKGLQAILGIPVIPLFTLNYDEAVESAVDELRDYALVDGFRTGYRPVWTRDVFDKFAEGGLTRVVLFKLHGSVSWTRPDGSDRIERTVSLPRRRPGREHVVLYPTRLHKAIDKEPFATAYQYFEAALSRARLGVFIGTSFRDAELLQVISRASDRAKPFTLMAVGPDVNRGEVASRTGFPGERVRAVNISFQPDQIPALFTKINAELSSRG